MRRKSIAFILCITMMITLIPTIAFAAESEGDDAERYSTEQSIQGAAAGRYYEDDGTVAYVSIPEIYYTLGMTSSMFGTYYLGVDTSAGFVPTENIDTAEMVITKNGVEIGREKAVIGQNAVRSGEHNGITYGIKCQKDRSSGVVKKLEGCFVFDLSTNAFRYFTQLAGSYEVTLYWSAEGKNYTAKMSCILYNGVIFSSLNINRIRNGIITEFWGRPQEADDTVQFEYNRLEAYYGEHWDNAKEERVNGEVTKLFLYTDSNIDGVFDFVGCSEQKFEEIFTAGEAIRFDDQSEIIPLCVHPNLITEDMIGESCVLTFKNGDIQRQITIKVTEEDTSYLKENMIYAAEKNSLATVASGNGESVKLCCGDFQMQYSLKNSLELHIQGGYQEYVFLKYESGSFQSISMAELSAADAEKVKMTLESSDDNIFCYRLEGLKKGKIALSSQEDSNLKLPCEVDFPYIAFFSKRERTEDAFQEELHYVNAVEEGQSAAYFYLIAPTQGIKEQSKLNVSFCGYYQDDEGQWAEKYYNEEGITFTPDGSYYDASNGETYFVWMMAMTDQFRSDDNDTWKNLCIYDGETPDEWQLYYIGGGVTMYDATEITSDKQLYWFYQDDIKVENGKAVLDGEYYESLDDCAQTNFNRWSYSGRTEAYFAIKQDGDYVVVDTAVLSDDPDKIIISQGKNYKYAVRWSGTGKYLLTTTFNEKAYFLKMKVEVSGTEFYSKNTPDGKWILDNEFYFNEAIEKSADEKEVYFYLISDQWDVNADCTPTFLEWNDELNEYADIGNIDGISFGDVQIITTGDEKYYSWKVTVTDQYRANDDPWKKIGLKKNGEIVTQPSIAIYDITEALPEYGNINGDWRGVDLSDVLYFKRYLAGWYGYDRVEKRTADLNLDSEVNAADLMILERHLAGWSGYETLPYGKERELA